jgi:hypothetical protein
MLHKKVLSPFVSHLEISHYIIKRAWPRGQCARRTIVESKQRSDRSVIGWVPQKLSRATPCFGRHVKPLIPAALQSLAPALVPMRFDVRQVAGRKKNSRIFITT